MDFQIFVHTVGLDDLAGIHAPFRIPNGFELAEGLNEFRPNISARVRHVLAHLRAHLRWIRQDLRTVSGLFHKLTEVTHPFFRFEIEIYAHVDAGMPKVSIHGAAIAKFGLQLADRPEIDAQLFGGTAASSQPSN